MFRDSMDFPAIVERFWDAAARRDFDAVAMCFSQDAEVTDEDETRKGRAAIAAWQAASRAKWNYTVTATGFEPTNDGVRVMAHLEGDFPGGEADVVYRFSIEGDLIHRLVVE